MAATIAPSETRNAKQKKGCSQELTKKNGEFNAAGKALLHKKWEEMSGQEQALISEAQAQRKRKSDEYDAKVRQAYADAQTRRLEGERTIRAANGKPFKTEQNAQKLIDDNHLNDSHEATQEDGGWVAKKRTGRQLQEREDAQKGIASYDDLQERAIDELGLRDKVNPELGLDEVLDQAQLDALDARVDYLQRQQRGMADPRVAHDETGEFGAILTQYRHDAQGAIAALAALQDGEAVAALHHPDVGDIDLVWGETSDNPRAKGYGVAKLVRWHPEVLGDLQGFISRLKKDNATSGKSRVRLTDGNGHAVVNLDWKGQPKRWLLTAYEEAGADTTMDTASNDSKGDTARLEPSTGASVVQAEQAGNAKSAEPVNDSDALRQRFTVKIGGIFGDIAYRAAAPVDAKGGDVLSSRVITAKTKLSRYDADGLGIDNKQIFAWRVSVIRNKEGGIYSVIEAMNQDYGRTPDGEVNAYFQEVKNPESMEHIAPAINRASYQDYQKAKLANTSADIFAEPSQTPKTEPQKPKSVIEKMKEAKAAKEANAFIESPSGGLDYGEITPDMAKAMRRQAGKIRLQQGVQNADGTGWGLAHIEANHGEQIRALGFKSGQDFVEKIAGGIQQVWQVAGSSQLLVTVKDGRKDVMFIRLEPSSDGDFYRVNTAFPVRQEDYEVRKGMKKLWDWSEPNAATTGQQPAFATTANASPETESSQGSSNAHGQSSASVAQTEQGGKAVQAPANYHQNTWLGATTDTREQWVRAAGFVGKNGLLSVQGKALLSSGFWTGFNADIQNRLAKSMPQYQAPVETRDGEYVYSTEDGGNGFTRATFAEPSALSGLTVAAQGQNALQDKIEQVKELHRSSPHLDKRWTGEHGAVTSVVLSSLPTMGANSEGYLVSYADGGKMVFDGKRFDERMQKDAALGTDEGKAARDAEYRRDKDRAEVVKEKQQQAESKAADDRAQVQAWLETTDIAPVQKAKLASTLATVERWAEFDEPMTRSEFVRRMVSDGKKPRAVEEKSRKPKSRKAVNAMDNAQQAEYEKWLAESPTKTTYRLGDYDATKAEYDYANYLMAQSEESKPNQEAKPSNGADSGVAEGKKQATNQEKPAADIQDFGEKLEGARKDLPPSLKDELGESDIAALPLSKIWPANAHESMEDDGQAALVFAARELIPAKPRTPHKLKAWVQTVKTARELVNATDDEIAKLANGGTTKSFRTSSQLDGLFTKVRLLTQLPRDTWGRVGAVRGNPDAYRPATPEELAAKGITKNKQGQYLRDGKEIPYGDRLETLYVKEPVSSVEIDGKSHWFNGVSKIGVDEVQKVQELLGTAAPKKSGLTAADFEIRRNSNKGFIFINRKGDSEYRHLKTFEGVSREVVSQVRAWLNGNVHTLATAWEAVKARDNVSKADMRGKENRERNGKDWRGGKDATPEMFDAAFGFRGVQFGNWVGQTGAKNRQEMLNDAYDALHDLADLLGLPTQAMSLSGELGLAFGARGKGAAAAHYERDQVVINLTKTKGAGALAHEWFHALDNYFQKKRGTDGKAREDSYITYKPEPLWEYRSPRTGQVLSSRTAAQLTRELSKLDGYDANQSLAENVKSTAAKGGYNWVLDKSHPQGVRQQVESAFAELVEALNASPMAQRANALDKAADGYWGRIIERGARSFENHVIHKMAEQGLHNDYLANVTDPKAWEMLGKNPDRYPYLTAEEQAPISEAFDKLFDTIETRQEDGKTVLFSRSANTKAAYEARIDALFGGEKATTGTRVLDRSDVMGLLGHPNVPLVLNESHLRDGMTSHPEMTAAIWKKVPEWIDNPAIAFKSENKASQNRVVLLAPETVAGYPVRLVIDYMPERAGAKNTGEAKEHLLVTAFAKTNEPHLPPVGRLAADGGLLYVDNKIAPELWLRRGVQFPKYATTQGRGKILTEKNLAGWRKANAAQSADNAKRDSTAVTPANAPSTVAKVQSAIEGMFEGIADVRERIAQGTTVVQDASELPENLRQGAEDARAQALYDPYSDRVYMIASRIEQGQEKAVWLHEVFHKRGADLLRDALPRLHQAVQRWASRPANSVERQIYEAAHARATNDGNYEAEFLAYAIEEAVNRGVRPDLKGNITSAGYWLGRVREAFSKVIAKLTGVDVAANAINAKDLVTAAYGSAGLEVAENTAARQAGRAQRKNINSQSTTGHAQPLDEPVLTPSGWRSIGELQVGDEVYAHDGSITQITGVYPQGEQDVFRVELDDGRFTRATTDHLWQLAVDEGGAVTIATTSGLTVGDALPVV